MLTKVRAKEITFAREKVSNKAHAKVYTKACAFFQTFVSAKVPAKSFAKKVTFVRAKAPGKVRTKASAGPLHFEAMKVGKERKRTGEKHPALIRERERGPEDGEKPGLFEVVKVREICRMA